MKHCEKKNEIVQYVKWCSWSMLFYFGFCSIFYEVVHVVIFPDGYVEAQELQPVRETGFQNIDEYAIDNNGKGWFHAAYRRLRDDQSPHLHHITADITKRWIDWYEMINQCHEQARQLNQCLGARQEMFKQFKAKYPNRRAPIVPALTKRDYGDLMFFYQRIPLQMPTKAWYPGAVCQKKKDDIDKQWSDEQYIECLDAAIFSFNIKMNRAMKNAQATMDDFTKTQESCLLDLEKLREGL